MAKNARLMTLLMGAVTGLWSCGREVVHEQAQISQFYSMRAPHTAPLPIQKAAAAVVLIETEGSKGTGSFISDDGLLLTNDHVLGTKNCAAEGCYFKIRRQFEEGTPRSEGLSVFGQPVFVSSNLDSTVLQVYDIATSGEPLVRFRSPDYLTWQSRTSQELANETLYVVGHPHGTLKKWTRGQVIRGQGNWFVSNHFSLPGMSGAPVLNSQGQIVGLHHRGPQRFESFTVSELQTFSIHTASAPILMAYKQASLEADPLGALVKVKAPAASADDVAARHEVYAHAHLDHAKLDDGSLVFIPDLLAARCDAFLAKPTASSPDDFEAKLAPCHAALDWLECSAQDRYGLCPLPAAANLWRQRFAQLATIVYNYNGEVSYQWQVDAPAALEMSEEQRLSFGRGRLAELIRDYDIKPNFMLASYLASYAGDYRDPSMVSVRVSDYLTHYYQQANYAYFIPRIISGLASLTRHRIIEPTTLMEAINRLMRDRALTFADRLFLEQLRYEWGIKP